MEEARRWDGKNLAQLPGLAKLLNSKK